MAEAYPSSSVPSVYVYFLPLLIFSKISWGELFLLWSVKDIAYLTTISRTQGSYRLKYISAQALKATLGVQIWNLESWSE
jgi:hypothetical protein